MNIKKTLKLSLPNASYDITVGSGLLRHADKFFNLNRRVMIVTDSGVPREYAEAIADCCLEYRIHVFEQGEASKNIRTYEGILSDMLDFGMQRRDCVVAVGGGVCGDISGFAAGSYMRGIDFYNVPTTLLSQVDSSVGGKCAIDFMGAKNIVGVFHQPKGVLIDTDTLSTLDKRQVSAGLAEAVKMAATSDAKLFSLLETCDIEERLDEIIIGAISIKRAVVEADEKESGLRKILNFGHTLGHGIEAVSGLLHGECVALGMLPMCRPDVRERLIKVLKKCSLPVKYDYDKAKAYEFMKHDKKGFGDKIDAVFVDEIGTHRTERVAIDELINLIESRS